MNKFSSYGMASLFLSVALQTGFAHSFGPAPRLTGAPGDNVKACTLCHSSSALNSGTGSVNIILQSGAFYIPGVKQRIQVQVSDPNQQRWGFEFSARLNSDLQNGQAGDLVPVDNLTQTICEDYGPKPCSSGVLFIEHTSAGTRPGTKLGSTFQFDWTPPATNVGPVTFYVAGNAANNDKNLTGDFIYTSSVQLSPLTPIAPVVTAGNIVSAATSIAGPVGANSWVSVYGTNLASTTRGWTDGDFINGAMPTSLDGVSIVMTVFGAPRLAYIGYVSPTQVNFLIPSDGSATTYQIQVRNPAGISAIMPITVQASAPQLLTSDGKHVFGTHADGTLLGTVAASPGESVVLFATGCGTTNPALTPGQVPTALASLVTLPSVTIGGTAATVVSAGIVPGTGGVYQINMQIPAGAASGDLPVAVTIGSFTSAAPVITVEH